MQCIALVVNLKAQITNIVGFFEAIASTVELVLYKQVKPFIDTMRASTSDDAKVGEYTITDLQRSVSSACVKFLILSAMN